MKWTRQKNKQRIYEKQQHCCTVRGLQETGQFLYALNKLKYTNLKLVLSQSVFEKNEMKHNFKLFYFLSK